VEFLVQLQGKKSKVGVDAFLGGEKRSVGFRNALKPYKIGSKKEPGSERKTNEEHVELARRALSRAHLFLIVEKCEGALYRLVLNGSDALQLEAVRGKCWPITLNPAYGMNLESLRLGELIAFPNLTIHALTSFIAFEISAGEGSKTVTARFVLNLPLQGAPNDRFDAVLRLVLRNHAQLLRYLIFLLASDEDKVGATMSLLLGRNGRSEMAAGQPDAVPLFEELVRTMARAPDKLDAVQELVNDLRSTPEGTSLLPEGFDKVWEPIWAARLADKEQ
jgi:hypothetical protein